MEVFSEDIKNSVAVLKSGGVILYPTDTIWGLGCDATNSAAVSRIFALKEREENRSLIILVNGIELLSRYVKDIPQTAMELASVSDDPLTIIYPEGRNLAEGVCSTDGSVGIRICNDPFCNELISRFRKPVVSTSANTSGKSSPSFFEEIEPELIKRCDYVVKYRRDDRRLHKPSPVIRIENDGSLKIIRR